MRTHDLVLTQTIWNRASNINIEPQPSWLRVRFRIDGILQEVGSLPMTSHAPLVSRIKMLARMNIAERRLPQDRQFTFKACESSVDVRAASIEMAYGERVVMRVLDKTTSLMALSDLEFLPQALAQYDACPLA